MALRNLSSALPRAPEPHDEHEPPVEGTSDSEVADTSESDSDPEVADDISDSEETEIGEKMEKKMDQFLEKLKNAGMEINEEMARIIEEERTRIPEAARDAVMAAENKAEISWGRLKAPVTTTAFYLSLLTFGIASGFAGSWLGLKFCMCSALKQAIKDIVKAMFESRGRPVPDDFFFILEFV